MHSQTLWVAVVSAHITESVVAVLLNYVQMNIIMIINLMEYTRRFDSYQDTTSSKVCFNQGDFV